MFEHGLLEFRKNQATDKKRTKEEKDLLMKSKPFASLMSKRDYEKFSNGVLRKNGIISFEGGPTYEIEKAQRVNSLY